MNVLDIVLAALLLFGSVKGFLKGFFVEIASLVALIAGVYGAIHFSNYASEFLMEHVEWSEKTVNITAFVITFIIIVLAISLAGKALTKLADFAALGFFNKILGAVFGAIKIGLILSIVLIIFDKMNKTIAFVDKQNIEESALYSPVKSLAPSIFPSIIHIGTEEDLETETSDSE